MGRKGRLVFIIAMLAIIVIAISVPAFAIWSDGSNVGGAAAVTLFDDITSRYLVYDGVTSAGKHYYLTYNDAGYFEGNDSYNKSYQEGGVWYSKYDEEVDLTTTSLSYVSVIGYTGSLGQYESLVIPDSITWKDSLGSEQANMHNINVTHINMQSSAAFPSLKLIKSIVIPNTITNIDGVSFSFMPSLEALYFNFADLTEYASQVTINGVLAQNAQEVKMYFYNSSTSEYYEFGA